MMLDPSDAEAYEKYSDELVASGVVIAIPAGAATLYSLNSDHVAYPPIKQLSAMYDSVLEQIRDEIQGWSPAAVTVALFGSIAREMLLTTAISIASSCDPMTSPLTTTNGPQRLRHCPDACSH
jgi:hypothetical protein